ncbi:zinc finger CCHC domain-containing protein 3-like [Xenopus tropicalis]|uniref:Zinc finger CCHC domain-containing protein 3-like n=1 Tax=Xenopus tropicalis TaxID=8364 RepID=A0A803JFD7_XENTR|nr:zinc finger CCHC domain-containing protein 3-like [Xenopus tropicalis]
MAAEDGSVPAFVRVKHSVRIIAADPENREKGLAYVVQVVLEEFGRVSRREILAIQDYPKRGIYDITFDGEGIYRSFVGILEECPNDPRLGGFKIVPHFAEEEKFLVVKSYSPFVPLKEIEAVLSRYCKKLVFSGKILNELGIWTSKYRFKAVFEKGVFPPARFRLGTVNIDCFFNGMPEFCKRCRLYGHVTDGCVRCQNCGKDGHEVKSCSVPKKCNFCLQEGHLYAGCPQRKAKEEKPKGNAGKLPVQVEPTTESSGEEASAGKASQGKLAVKRKKVEKKGKQKPEVSATVETVETMVVESLSRGERLYNFFKEKSNPEIQAALSDWSDEDEYDYLAKCINETPEKKDIRKKVLDYMRSLK